MSTVLVKSNRPSLIRIGGVGAVPRHNPASGKFVEGEGIHGGVVLRPGVNKLTKEQWDHCMMLATTKAMLQPGKDGSEPLLELVEVKDGFKTLGDLKDSAAIKLVRETLTPELLTEWQSSEKREPVLKAIEHQLAKFKVKKPEGGDKGEGAGGKTGGDDKNPTK